MRDDPKKMPPLVEPSKPAVAYQKPTVVIDASEDVKRSAFGACCGSAAECTDIDEGGGGIAGSI